MSKKITTLSIILLVFGGIMIPGGPMINNIIQDMTYGSIDEGLLGIKEQGIPLVKESVEEMGLKSVAISLSLVKEMGADASELLANATIWMGCINTLEIKMIDMSTVFEPLYWDMGLKYQCSQPKYGESCLSWQFPSSDFSFCAESPYGREFCLHLVLDFW